MSADDQILTEVLAMRGELSTVNERTERIETQTTLTNDRVTALELWQANHDHKIEVDHAVEAGAAAVRAGDLAKLRTLREFILDDALKVALVGLAGLVAGMFWGKTEQLRALADMIAAGSPTPW